MCIRDSYNGICGSPQIKFRFSFTHYSHTKHMVESIKLSLLLIRHRHITAGPEEQVMSIEAGTKEQVTRPRVSKVREGGLGGRGRRIA